MPYFSVSLASPNTVAINCDRASAVLIANALAALKPDSPIDRDLASEYAWTLQSFIDRIPAQPAGTPSNP